MYLSKLILNPRSRDVRRDLADCQQMHRTLLSAFPQADSDTVRAEFGLLFRVEVNARSGHVAVLVQARCQPDWSRLQQDGYLLTEPLTSNIADKYSPAVLHHQRQLRFRLRANPTRKIETKSLPDGTKRNGRRVELFREEDQIAWLQRKAETAGFRILHLQLNADVPNVRAQPENKTISRTKRLTFGSVLFEGELEIINTEQFIQTLCDGIGTGKAYGFGLLSIAPVVR
jgi:CRISPR system Cascade subunit CasE